MKPENQGKRNRRGDRQGHHAQRKGGPQAESSKSSERGSDSTGSAPTQQSPSVLRHWLGHFEGLPHWAQVTLGIVVLLGVATIVTFLSKVGQAATPTAAFPVAAAAEAVNRAHEEAVSLADARREEILLNADTTLNLADELDDAIRGWRAVEDLLENSDGKFIGSDQTLVRAYDAIRQRGRVSSEEAKRYRSVVERLIAPVRRAAGANSEFVPSDQLAQELARHQKTIRTALATYREQRGAIESLRNTAKELGVAGDITLASAIAKANELAERRRAQLIASEVEKARADAAQEEADARAEQERVLGQQHAENIRKETEVMRQAAVKKQLRREAEDPTVRAKFAPFLEKGWYRLARTRSRRRKLPYPMPASYHDLQNLGSLTSVRSFVMCASGQTRECGYNDRSRWSVPTTEEGWKEMKNRYEQFMRLAPVWMQLGYVRK